MNALFLLSVDPGGAWLGPVIGAVVFGLAFLLGWRLLSAWLGGARDSDAFRDANFLGGVTRERRAAPRRQGNTVEVQLVIGKTTLRGWVRDRSQGGLGLVVEQPVAEGTTFKVRASSAAARVPWTDASVLSCRPTGERFELSCQFDRVPDRSELLTFG
jgi:hypothetical protein